HELAAVAFGQGPGGFTGLRVACAIAQGIAFSLDIGVIPVGSLFAAAYSVQGSERLRVVVQDARMNEVYLAAFRNNDSPGSTGWQELQAPVLLAADAATAWVQTQLAGWLQTLFPAADAAVAPEVPVEVKMMGDAPEVYPQYFGILCHEEGLSTSVRLRA